MTKVRTTFPVRDVIETDINKYLEQINRNYESLLKQDREAKANGTLVGRFLKEPFADGYAFYVIVGERKKTVRIIACSGLGDDWRIPYWGEEVTIDKAYTMQNIQRREALQEIFGSKE